MRLRLKGINRSVKRLADGTVKTFWYAWRGGPRLTGEPGTPEFVASYNAAVATRWAPLPGTLRGALTAYQASSAFAQLRDRTRKDYAWHIDRIQKRFHNFPVAAFSDPRTRGVFLKWRDELGTVSPRQADLTWAVLNIAVNWGLDRGLVVANPFTKAGSLYHGSRADQVWSDEDERQFLANAPECLRLPFLMAVWTGQRQGDLLCLPWSRYDGRVIRLRQSKGGRRVVIPVGGPLKAALDAAPKICPLILTDPEGQPWSSNSFRKRWWRACKAAGIEGLTFHDLRGTAVTRLAIAGATEPEIVAITGHALNDVRSILDANYLHRDPQLAENAIRKLETRTNLQTGLQTGPGSGDKKP
jgi:integrase